MPKAIDPSTRAIHADAAHAQHDSSVAPPIYPTTNFAAASAAEFAAMANDTRHERYYTRYGNPTLSRTAAVIADLESNGGSEQALLFASGMGAISATVLALVRSGDHVVGQRSHYMGTSRLLDEVLPSFGVQVTLVDQTDTDAWAAAIRPGTVLVLAESPVNPTMALTDLAAVAQLARQAGALLAVDNTFASPINQQPLGLGADLVLHSCTKYFAGHSDVTAGAVVARTELIERIWDRAIVLGATLGPLDAWLVLRGIRTLPLRVRRCNDTALRIAQFLGEHPAIEQVCYPGLASHPQHALASRQMRGFGGMLSFRLRGDYAATSAFVSRLTLARQAVSLGGVESLAVHAAAMWAGTMNDAQMRTAGIAPNAVRFSVGLEAADDLVDDLRAALGGAPG
jgi:cystathionine beta-lyase/cystathionine gamma-synthase